MSDRLLHRLRADQEEKSHADAGDLRRHRLLVLFRLPPFAPHLVWASLWGIAAIVVAVIDWFATLFGGTSPVWAHSFLARYVRYWVHILAGTKITPGNGGLV